MMGAQPYLISIHAPRVGSDQRVFEHLLGGVAISIHAPRVGSDIMPSAAIHWPRIFLSTLPAWGATACASTTTLRPVDFYPRSPRGERLSSSSGFPRQSSISIHAPRVGSDRAPGTDPGREGAFLSTLPAWGATGPLLGGELRLHNFSPRSPRGERPPKLRT